MTANNLIVAPTDEQLQLMTWGEIVDLITEKLTESDMPEKVIRCVEFLLSGYSISETARELEVSTKTIRNWLEKYPDTKMVLSQAKPILSKYRLAQLEKQLHTAINVSDEILRAQPGDNPKLLGVKAQHARYIMGLFFNPQTKLTFAGDVNINVGENRILKADTNAIDYMLERMKNLAANNQPDVVEGQFVEPLFKQDGSPNFGELGILAETEEGIICHICGKPQKRFNVHIITEHNISAGQYEIEFGLPEGTI